MGVLFARRHAQLWMMWPKRMTNHVSDQPWGASAYGFRDNSYPLARRTRASLIEQFEEDLQRLARHHDWWTPEFVKKTREEYEPRRTAITYEMLGRERP